MELQILKNEDAENSLLSALLFRSDLINDVYGKIKAQHFYVLKNQIIFTVIEKLFNESITVDIISVSAELEKQGKLKDIGGRAFINDLALSCMTTAQYGYWIKLILEQWRLRQIQNLGNLIIGNCQEQLNSEEILSTVQSKIFTLTFESSKKDGQDLSEILSNRYKEIGDAYDDYNAEGTLIIKNVIKTGWSNFDRIFRGGFRSGELTMIAARSRIGKTAFEIGLERQIAKNNPLCAIASFQAETPVDEVADRHFANLTGTKKAFFTYVNNLDDKEFKKLNEAQLEVIEGIPHRIYTYTDFNVLDIANKAQQFFNSVNRKGIIFIDNLNLLDDVNKGKNEIEITTNITRDCKKLAMRLDVPVVLLCQLTKESEDNTIPILKNIRGSMQVISNSDYIILLHRDTNINQNEVNLQAIVDKVRRGQPNSVLFNFDMSTNSFKEINE